MGDDNRSRGLECTITEDEFGVDIRDVDVLELVIVKQMEEHCARTNKGLDIGGALLDICGKACPNFRQHLPLSTGPLEEWFRHVHGACEIVFDLTGKRMEMLGACG
jgi:hypothetical protein